MISAFERVAISYLNIPYIWGGKNPSGFDCSGLVCAILKSFNVLREADVLNAQGLLNLFVTQPGVKPLKEAGALVFYGASKDSIKHVAYCISEYLCVEAHGDSSCTSIAKSLAWNNGTGAYVRISSIKRRNDIVICLRPRYVALGEGASP